MQLKDLMNGVETTVEYTRNLEISGLAVDSRKVEAGYLFAALPGSKVDGHSFIPEAIKRGAVAVLSRIGADIGAVTNDNDTQFIPVADPNHSLAIMAANFYEVQPQHICAVTGTNGKTSIADFVRQMWEIMGQKAASVGTLGVISKGYPKTQSLTTPDPITLHFNLAELKKAGVDYLAMEASSHGLHQHRLDGVRVSVAGFTNLTRDHMDYHGNMKEYFAAKKRLFTEILAEGGVAVINADIPEYRQLAIECLNTRKQIYSYGKNATEIQLVSSEPSLKGQKLTINLFGAMREINLPLAGEFQAMNALCALGMVIAMGAKENEALSAIEKIKGASGRLECVGHLKNNSAVYIDYAHTPDALETVIRSLRPHCDGKLRVLFGCGGDRDKGKRPMMGKIAAKLADVAYVTDDNPRSEEAEVIRSEIMSDCEGGIEISDRRKAIEQAIAELEANDILIIAGKGHEEGQIIKGVIHPFSDHIETEMAICKKEGRQCFVSYSKPCLWDAKTAESVTYGIAKGEWKATGVAIDHREVKAGDLYIAVKTTEKDGHNYVAEALEKGAIAAVVHKVPKDIDNEKLLIVNDTSIALEDLANEARKRSKAKFVAITSKNKEDKTLQLISKAISSSNVTIVSEENSSPLGLAKDMASIPENAECVLLELSHEFDGILKSLSTMAQPDITLISGQSVGGEDEHKVLSEIFSGIKIDGIAILNRDEADFESLAFSARNFGLKRMVSFGKSPSSYVSVLSEKSKGSETEFTLKLDKKEHKCILDSKDGYTSGEVMGAFASLLAMAFNVDKAVENLGSK